MDATEWLRLVALGIPGTSAPAAARIAGYALRIRTAFPETAFTQATATDVVEGMIAAPTYSELQIALQALGPFAVPMRRDQEDNQTAAWRTYLNRRLAEGADAAHLLSLAKTHVPDSGRDEVIRDLFPAAWRREQERRSEVLRDKAKGLAFRVSRALAPPKGPAGPSGAEVAPSTPRESHLPTAAFNAWRERSGQ